MDYDLTDEQIAIQQAARTMLARHSTMEHVHAVARTGAYDDELTARQVELGWHGIAIPTEYGGSGLGVSELAVLLHETGYALAASGLLSSTAAALVIQAAGSGDQRAKWLPRLADGTATAALAILGHPTAKLVADGAEADVVVVVDGGAGLIETEQERLSPVDTIDRTRRCGMLGDADLELMPGDPTPGVDAARVALAAETVGVCQRVLDVTVEYAKERRQFDRSIGSFQAVQHMLVEMLMLTEGTRSGILWAAWSLDTDADDAHEAALIAKAAASDAGRSVTSMAIQAHGGIAFTWEADLHWYFKCAQMNARALGGAHEHRAALTCHLEPRRPPYCRHHIAHPDQVAPPTPRTCLPRAAAAL